MDLKALRCIQRIETLVISNLVVYENNPYIKQRKEIHLYFICDSKRPYFITNVPDPLNRRNVVRFHLPIGGANISLFIYKVKCSIQSL